MRLWHVVGVALVVSAPGASGLSPTRRAALPRAATPPAPLVRLRGGASPLQGLQNAYFGVPVFTRSWLSAIVAFAALNQIGLVPPEMLGLDATATVKRMQIWRPLTAASFLGGLGPQLLQKCYYLVQFGCQLERALGIAEFARVLASCAALLCIVCSTLGMQFIGDGLIMAITVLTCNQSPDQQVNMYGLNIPCAYLPFAQLCMSYLFTQQIPWTDILGALVGYVNYMINDNCKPDSVIYKRDNYAAKATSAKAKGAKTLGGSSSSSKKGGGGGKGGGGSKPKRKSNIATFAKEKTCGPDGCSL